MLDILGRLFGNGQEAEDGAAQTPQEDPAKSPEAAVAEPVSFPRDEKERPAAFACTVTGASHLKSGTPCQDASAVYADQEGRYYIAVVSDGHGDRTCVRSDRGSAFAVSSALENLRIFGDSLTGEDSRLADILPTSKHEDMVVRKLTDAILYGWRTRVLKDLEENPLSEEELDAAGRYGEKYRKGERLEHAYGATLIAALWTRDQLLMIQQGDGQLDLFLSDDSVQTPVPWDDRCYANVTTSICDTDAADSFRHLLLDLEQVPVIACCIGSDGVEDSFANPAGRFHFYRQILAASVDPDRKETFAADLKETLQDLTARGSGDDTSVAVLYLESSIRAAAQTFVREAGAYFESEELRILQGRLDSMARKSEALQQKAEEARQKVLEAREALLRQQTLVEDLERQQKAAEEEYMKYEDQIRQIRDRIRQLGENS